MKIPRILFFIGLVLSITSLYEVSADSRTVYQVTNIKPADVLNVRQNPSSKSTVVLQLPADAKWILKRTAQRKGHWQKVIWGAKEGWVYDRYIGSDAHATQVLLKHRQCVKNNPANSICCGFTGSPNRNLIKVYKVVGVPRGQSLNVRASGNAKARRITNIPHDAVGIVKFPGKRVKNGNAVWQKVRWNGRDGWVNASFLKYDPIISDYRNIVQQACAR
jgi:hypothetical protein